MGDPGLDGRIILRWIFKKWVASMDWFELAHNQDRWCVVVNVVMNFQFGSVINVCTLTVIMIFTVTKSTQNLM